MVLDMDTTTISEGEDSLIKVVMISDTHGKHRELDNTLPDGDILIHAGDFSTHYNIEDAIDFNEWLGTLPHRYKIVVNGNHDSPICIRVPNSHKVPWSKETSAILSNAILLSDSSVKLEIPGKRMVNIYGTNFYHPMDALAYSDFQVYEKIPSYSSTSDIESNIDILVSHVPPKGFGDCPPSGISYGCDMVAMTVKRVRPKLFVCGHIHSGHGMKICDETGITYVNAANALKRNEKLAFNPIVTRL